ncbi:hypothetical protein [Chryseobacterium sp.]|uniref:hypothetical protein n=1 Tax=Chryseobacterium sp. TaxID=1871047 RepID=UPI0011C95C69|nr:hypothetical protein [Chryseobacterium sp.]TXF79059.1 hypothetical protein FUA25_01320 [Chryseobacterium sp.]
MKLKTFTVILVLFCAFNFSSAQTKQWKEQEEFHKVMSATFHPAEEGNLAPLKLRSAELAAKANDWRKSEIPATVSDKKAVKKSLNKLCKDSKKLNKSLKKGASESELKTELAGLHDTFHTIVGLCSAKEEHHDAH